MCDTEGLPSLAADKEVFTMFSTEKDLNTWSNLSIPSKSVHCLIAYHSCMPWAVNPGDSSDATVVYQWLPISVKVALSDLFQGRERIFHEHNTAVILTPDAFRSVDILDNVVLHAIESSETICPSTLAE